MGKRFIISEDEKKKIRDLYLIEEPEKKEDSKFCHGGNVKQLDEIVGDDELDDYIEGVQLRKRGVNGLADKIELLKTLRLHPKISDGGEHLCFLIMNNLKGYKPYNYFDETKKECGKAMDKVIELYKENDHGEELVKDLEKLYVSNYTSARAKEFLKHSLNMVKGG
jgi:hypothetical protein